LFKESLLEISSKATGITKLLADNYANLFTDDIINQIKDSTDFFDASSIFYSLYFAINESDIFGY
jgi:hypothetical protein